jgi:hypothetical protein
VYLVSTTAAFLDYFVVNRANLSACATNFTCVAWGHQKCPRKCLQVQTVAIRYIMLTVVRGLRKFAAG